MNTCIETNFHKSKIILETKRHYAYIVFAHRIIHFYGQGLCKDSEISKELRFKMMRI